MLIDGPSLLALAVVLGAIVYYVFFRNVWLARRMKPLVELLDAGTARLEGGRLSGKYAGKRAWFEYHAQTRAGPAAMRIGVSCGASFSFRIHKQAESLQPAERACLENLEEGSLDAVKSGDPLWDSELALAAEGEASFRRWVNRPDVHEAVGTIALRPLTTILLCKDGALWAVYPGASAEAVFQDRFAREALGELVSLSETLA
ncbi:MAG: hypothetical protein OXG62_13330 [Nitrospinae bacterium]|nr:hypothetical protein [Nitrospinota bacterium]